jgi:hypothetical protein
MDRPFRLPLAILEAYDLTSSEGGIMRLLLGRIFGALLTVGGVYVADSDADGVERRRMVNWDVVGQKVSELTADMQVLWHDFTRQMTGPP